jgi:hypothetical protein
MNERKWRETGKNFIMRVLPIASHLPSIAGTGKLRWMKTKDYKKSFKLLRPKSKKNLKIFPRPLISVMLNGGFFCVCLEQNIEVLWNDTVRKIHGEKSVSLPSDPPQTLLLLARIQSRHSSVRGKTLSPWAMAWPMTVVFSWITCNLDNWFRISQETWPTG